MASYTIHHYPSLAQDTIARGRLALAIVAIASSIFADGRLGEDTGFVVTTRNPRTRVGRWLNKIWKGRRGAAVKSEFFHRFELRPFIRDRFMISGDGYTREYLVARRGICSF